MWSEKREIQNGDLIIVWLTREFVQPLHVTAGKLFNSKFGSYRHDDLIGLPYGSKVASSHGRGFIHVLRPTPELWTMALPHRTQILYLADIAFVTSWLNIKPGSNVIEAGTGSGSFSHSTVRTIGPSGHLWSYEFHEARALKARQEFSEHGMSNVTLTHRNVCKDGFTVLDTVDAVFLDLPAPWEVVQHAKAALRRNRTTRICCFSPCMEQVLRTVNALNEHGFTEITMYETLMRPHEVSQLPPLKSVRQVGEELKDMAVRREERRLRQIASSAASRTKRKREEAGDQSDLGEAQEDTSLKRVKTNEREDGKTSTTKAGAEIRTRDNDNDVGIDTNENTNLNFATDPGAATGPIEYSNSLAEGETRPNQRHGSADVSEPTAISRHLNVSKVFPEVRGHTSYLTFACLVPFLPDATPRDRIE